MKTSELACIYFLRMQSWSFPKQYADTHRTSVSLWAPLSGRGSKLTLFAPLFSDMIIVLCCTYWRCKQRWCFQAQFHHAGHCNCVLYLCVVSNHSRDLQIETCRSRGPKLKLIPTMMCPVPSRCAAGGPVIKIKLKLVVTPFKARYGFVYDTLIFILFTWY
jgi:hypothetical protein